ncbi:MAG: sulfatase, partial [bacterium]|nr:sulfatase [bacterium]
MRAKAKEIAAYLHLPLEVREVRLGEPATRLVKLVEDCSIRHPPSRRRVRRGIPWEFSTACLLAVLLLSAEVSAAATPASPPNLLLITLDTFRADYLSYNGSSKLKTPNLDRLARGGVNFVRARSPVPLTLPSHTSILTGNYPPSHTVRDNADYIVPEEQLTLAEVLRSQGYNTAAFVGSFVLDSRFGLAQGFDLYDDRLASDLATLESFEAERSAGEVSSAFERWLRDRDRSRPFFSWVHFFDAHAPFVPPEPYLSRHQSDPYAGEIAYIDEVVGRIITKLESDDLLDVTIVAVVGDHGEGLGEHRELTHSVLIYNSTLHVPMMVHAPGLIPSEAKVGQLVRTIDLAPTLLDYLGSSVELGEGISLRSRIDDAIEG